MEIEMAVSRKYEASEDTDREMALLIAAGDTDAWSVFFDRYSAWTYRFAYRHLNNNHADAEDLCSDIMITAAKSIDKYNPGKGSIDAWLFGLARNRLSRFCRKRKIALPLIPDVIDQSSEPETADFTVAEGIFLKDAVNRAISCLPERQAQVLIEKYLEGYSTDELAERMGSTNKAVESLLSRARSAFRAAFEKLTAESSGGK